MRKRLLLIGAGHAHVAVLDVLRRQQARWRDELEITLITRELHKPFAGMLAGLVAGHYRNSECHLDVAALAESAGVALIQADVDQLDLTRKVVRFGQREWTFDMVSINTGASLPASVADNAYAVGVEPIGDFLQHWRALQEHIGQVERSVHLVVVGGGAPAVELVLAMAHRLARLEASVKWSLVAPGVLLPDFPRRTALRVERYLARVGVALHVNAPVRSVDQQKLHFADGTTAVFDALVWATKEAGPGVQAWLDGNAVACAEDGRIHVDRYLQSTTHPFLFVAGGAALQSARRGRPVQASAWWQGQLLAENLLRFAAGQELRAFELQRHLHQYARSAFPLVTLGRRQALASCCGLAVEGAWLWHWKDRRDRRFLQRLSGPFGSAYE